jgi:hypothetical protein
MAARPVTVNQLVGGPLALFDQIAHRQQQLSTRGEKLGQLPFVALSLLLIV